MTLVLTAFEARRDMLEHTSVASDASQTFLRVKTPEDRWGAVLEGVASATLPAKGFWVSALLLGIDLLKLV